MILYFSNAFKVGLKILFDKKPCVIENVRFVKPGKGQAFSRVKLRNLLTNQLLEKTLRTTDSLPSANVVDTKYMYIYHDNCLWYFMNRNTFDQLPLDKKIIQDKYKWLIVQHEYLITFWNKNPISIAIDRFAYLKVISDVIDKKSTSNKKYKLYKLQTGLIMQLPLFIQIGDVVKIDTKTEEYHSRINE